MSSYIVNHRRDLGTLVSLPATEVTSLPTYANCPTAEHSVFPTVSAEHNVFATVSAVHNFCVLLTRTCQEGLSLYNGKVAQYVLMLF